MTDVVGHFIAGRVTAEASANRLPIRNPATGAVRGEVALAAPETVAEAVAAAKHALPGWAATPPHKRARVLARFGALIEERKHQLAEIISAEHGKTVSDAAGEVMRGLEVVEFACGIPQLLKGEYTEGVGPHIDAYSVRQPLGVVAGITPFNFPAMVPLWMFPVAIACGNTFVLKPSEQDPSAAIELARLLTEAGAPEGVLNVVHGQRETVEALVADPAVKAVSFVGSTPVAQAIQDLATRHRKRVQALGGAKNHLVVLPDADLDKAADALIGAAYGSAGERCMAISVAVPVGDAAAGLVERVIEKAKALRVGPGSDPETDVGPLVSAEHAERVRGYVDVGEREGAEVLLDGRGVRVPGYEDGYFVGPTVLGDVKPEMRVYQEEIFGPVLCIAPQQTSEDALGLVNDHRFGNGAAIFTQSGEAARRFARRVEAGMVGVNVPIPVPMAFHSFGGWKESLFGDHAMHGPEGVRFYTRLKTVTTRWDGEGPAGGLDMPVVG